MVHNRLSSLLRRAQAAGIVPHVHECVDGGGVHAQRSARKRVAVGRDREWIAGPARSWPAIGVHLERVSVPVRFVQASSLGRLRSAEQRQPASQTAGRARSRHVPSLDALC